MLCPFITIILCHCFLHYQKLNKTFILSFLACFSGFLIFNSNCKLAFGFNFMLIVYILFNGYSDYKLKSIANQRSIEMMLFDNFMFFFVSFVVFLTAQFNETFTKSIFGIEKFDIAKISNVQSIVPLIIIAVLSFLAHNFKMLSFKASHIVGIAIVGIFFKSFNSILMTYIEYKTLPNLTQSVGLLTMCFSLSIFVYSGIKKRRNKD